MWIERHCAKVIKRAFSQFPAVVLTGARQTGKTSLARRLLPEANYVTFDIPRNAESASLDPKGFFSRYKEPLILDEIQYIPELFRYLKIMIDEDRRPGRFFITGSQDFPLMQGVTESLAGRTAVFSLPTLSLEEVDSDADLRKTDAFCWRSGFPELWKLPDLDRELWLGNYITTYLERDVRNILNVGNLRDFDRFLRAAAARAGRLLSLAELARDIGIAPNTAKSWISILQSSQQILLLEPYYTNVGKRLIKTPKLYFNDTGLLIYLMGFRNWESVNQHAGWGTIWENLVISEIHKFFLNEGLKRRPYFWRTVDGDEIDLLLEMGPRRFVAIECKTQAEIDKKGLRGFLALEKIYGRSALEKGAVVCRTDRAYPLTEGGRISAIPVSGSEGSHQWLMNLMRA